MHRFPDNDLVVAQWTRNQIIVQFTAVSTDSPFIKIFAQNANLLRFLPPIIRR